MTLEDYEKEMLRCSRCSHCKWVPLSQIKSWRFAYSCPSIAKYNFHTYSAGGRLIMGLALLKKIINMTESMLDIVYQCQMCGACDVSCAFVSDRKPTEIIHELRAKCVKEGNINPKLKEIIEDTRKYDNPYRESQESRGDWAKGLDIKKVPEEKAEILYYVGCTASFRYPDIARNTATILKKAGVDFGILGKDEKCCTSTSFVIGDEEIFEDFAKDNIETFNSLGVKTIVTSCAGCYHMLKVYYSRFGKPKYKVLHQSEFIEKLIKQGKIKLTKEVPMVVTYHDPCHLGRLSEPYEPSHGKEYKVLNQLVIRDVKKVYGSKGVYEPPRRILKKIPGLQLVEMERNREYAWCCGSGAGVKKLNPEFAEWTGEERIEEAEATGAEAIVTACPFCVRGLEDAIKSKGGKMKVYELNDIILKSME